MAIRNRKSRFPLVSIITPSYNSGDFIQECMKSVQTQIYPNVEHIIQDGGSKDNTVNLIKQYQKKHKNNKIKLASKPDSGPVEGYNRGLLRSRGGIILFLGSDDILMKNAVSRGVRNLAKYSKVAVVYGDEYIIDANSKIINKFIPKSYSFPKLICLDIVPPTEASFIRRSAFEKVGLYLDKTIKISPDYDLWIRIGQEYQMKHVNGFVTKYRWHSQSRSRSPKLLDGFIKDRKKVMDKLFASTSSPKKIKALRNRAYIGLFFWAATMLISYGKKYAAIIFLSRALLLNPRKETYKKYVIFWKQAVKDYENLSKLEHE